MKIEIHEDIDRVAIALRIEQLAKDLETVRLKQDEILGRLLMNVQEYVDFCDKQALGEQ